MLAACTSPEPTYYTLQPVPGTPQATRPLLIEVVRPGLAGYLDRSDIVLKQSDYHLALTSGARWGEPLADMIGRVLAQDLRQRLPGSSVFSGDGAIAADPELRVELNVDRFDANADGTVTASGALAIERGRAHRPLTAHTISFEAPASGADPAALAGTLSRLLGQIADQAAADIARNAPAAAAE
ncbi:MAG TPA: PqiC family protein [Acetobacteraceae bacterium]|nr:PqiC family protein [Acetobacteraceae bacterium]